MAFPAALTNAVDGVTEIVAAHLNNLEAKVGIDNSAVVTSLDYLLKNPASINPGHKHSKLWASDGDPEAVTVDASGLVKVGGAYYYGRLTVFGDGVLSNQGIYLFGVDKAIDVDGSNYFTAHYVSQAKADIAAGITDSGYRGGGRYEAFINDTNFEGTLATQYGIYCRVGILAAGATGARTINTVYGVFIDNLLSAGAITTNYGLFQASAAAKNYFAGNIGLGTTTFGTNAAKVLGIGSGTTPTTTPADMAQMWVEDINAAAGKAGLHMMAESGTNKLVVAGVIIKTNTGNPSQVHEGLMCINTADNTLKMYCEGSWRQLASWT